MKSATETPSASAASNAPRSSGANDNQPPVARTRFYSLRTATFAVLAVAALAWIANYALHFYRFEETDDAYVAGHLHQISAQLDGQVKEVLVQENQTVHAGDVLLRLDPLEFQIALQRADAALSQTRALEKQSIASARQADAALAEARARVAQAEAQLAQSDAQFSLAQLNLARAEHLLTHASAATQADVDTARSAFQVAQAARDAARAALLAVNAEVGAAEAAQVAAHAQTDAAAANVAVADAARSDAARRLAQATITAPCDGRVGNKHLESGNRIVAGQTLFALAESEAWVIANFKETQLPRMAPGQPVELTIDALPGQALHGRLDSVAPASGAQFALLPPDNSSGNFNKVVQRVPVKITLDADSLRQLGDRLRLGLSAVVDVRVR